MLPSMLDNSDKNARRNLFVFSTTVCIFALFGIPTADILNTVINKVSPQEAAVSIPAWQPYLILFLFNAYLVWCFLRSHHAVLMGKGFRMLTASTYYFSTLKYILLTSDRFSISSFLTSSVYKKCLEAGLHNPALNTIMDFPNQVKHISPYKVNSPSNNDQTHYNSLRISRGNTNDKYSYLSYLSIKKLMDENFLAYTTNNSSLDFSQDTYDAVMQYVLLKEIIQKHVETYSESESSLFVLGAPVSHEYLQGVFEFVFSLRNENFTNSTPQVELNPTRPKRSANEMILTITPKNTDPCTPYWSWSIFIKLFFKSQSVAYYSPMILFSTIALLILAGNVIHNLL